MLISVNGKTDPIQKHPGFVGNPEALSDFCPSVNGLG